MFNVLNNSRFWKHFNNMQIKIIEIYAAVIIIGGLYALLLFTTDFSIPCYFHEVTGFDCPGCGTSRMALSLMRLDFRNAFHYNPVAFIVIPMWILISLGMFIGRPVALRDKRVIMFFLYASIIAYTLFGVIRNLPI